jgi:hypothetical protein
MARSGHAIAASVLDVVRGARPRPAPPSGDHDGADRHRDPIRLTARVRVKVSSAHRRAVTSPRIAPGDRRHDLVVVSPAALAPALYEGRRTALVSVARSASGRGVRSGDAHRGSRRRGRCGSPPSGRSCRRCRPRSPPPERFGRPRPLDRALQQAAHGGIEPIPPVQVDDVHRHRPATGTCRDRVTSYQRAPLPRRAVMAQSTTPQFQRVVDFGETDPTGWAPIA